MTDVPDVVVGTRPWWAGLGWKLFAAFGSVIAVGVATLWLAVGFTAPGFFEQQMAGMMQSSGDMMGGSGGMGSPAMDAALAVAFRDAVTQALLVATPPLLTLAGTAAFATASSRLSAQRRAR